MANSFPGSGLAYADQFSVGTSGTQAASLYVCSSCVRSAVIENNYAQTNLHHNTLWLRQNSSSGCNYASIGFTIVNNGGDHHRVNIAAIANDATAGGNLALYTRNNNGNDTLGLYINHAGNTGIGTCNPGAILHVRNTAITAGAPSTGWPSYNIEDSTTSKVVCIDTAGNGNVSTAGQGATLSLILGQYFDSRVVITPAGAGSLVPADQGTGNGRDLMVKGGYSDNTNGKCGGRLWLNGGMGYSGGFNTNVGHIIMQTVGGGGNVGIGTSSPDAKLHICNAVAGNTDNFLIIVQNCCTVSGARAGIAFSNNNQTPSAGGLSGASIQTSNNGIDGTGNLLFGTLLSGTNTERMRITSAGNVGIGAASPAAKLHLCGSGDNIFRGESTNTGTVASYYITNVGATAKRYYAGVNVAAADGGYAISDSTCTDAVRFYIKSEGSIGIATISPTYKLHVNGTFYAAGSSQDYKQSICNYNTDSCMFMKLKPVTYQYKEEYCHLGKELKSGTQIGLIAEEVAESHPELAILVNEEDNKVVRNVDYEKLSVILLSEVQKLRREVDDLKHK